MSLCIIESDTLRIKITEEEKYKTQNVKIRFFQCSKTPTKVLVSPVYGVGAISKGGETLFSATSERNTKQFS